MHIQLSPAQIEIAEWAIEAMLDFVCEDDSLYLLSDIPTIQDDRLIFQNGEAIDDFLYRVGMQYDAVAKTDSTPQQHNGRVKPSRDMYARIKAVMRHNGNQLDTYRRIRNMLPFQYDDGGRKDAGYKGRAGDCVTRSIAIATGKDYQEVYDALNELAKSERIGKRKKKKSNSRKGVFRRTYDKYIKSLGWTWVPTMFIGSGCQVHLRKGELPEDKRLIVTCSKHLTAVINGTIHDVSDPSRDGTRCVYGYFYKDNENGK